MIYDRKVNVTGFFVVKCKCCLVSILYAFTSGCTIPAVDAGLLSPLEIKRMTGES